MSKATVKKAIADFDKIQLRDLVLDLYSKSKEVKEILDFYAEPKIEEKLNEYILLAQKELNRYYHRLPAPRVLKLRSMVKKLASFEVGPETVAKLMVYIIEVYTLLESMHYDESQINSVCKLEEDFLAYMKKNAVWEENEPILKKIFEKKPKLYSEWLYRGMYNTFEVFHATIQD